MGWRGFWICPSFKDHFSVAPCQTLYHDSLLFHRRTPPAVPPRAHTQPCVSGSRCATCPGAAREPSDTPARTQQTCFETQASSCRGGCSVKAHTGSIGWGGDATHTRRTCDPQELSLSLEAADDDPVKKPRRVLGTRPAGAGVDPGASAEFMRRVALRCPIVLVVGAP
jgi:hypothetical protein